MLFTTYREEICEVLEKCIKNRHQMIICPFGERGKQVKEILNKEYGIAEICVADNYYLGDYPVRRNSELQDYVIENSVILLCCEDPAVKKQIRESLSRYKGVPIIDVFPNDKIYLHDRQTDNNFSLQTEMKMICSQLHALVFKKDRSAYNTLEKYDKNKLAGYFEDFIAQTINNKSLQRAYSLLLHTITKDIWVNNNEPLAGTASYRCVNSTYPSGVYEEIYLLEKAKRIDEIEAVQLRDAWDMRLFTRFPGGHVVPGYDKILKVGIHDYLARLEEKLCCASENQDVEKCCFYQSEIIVLRALQELLKRYADTAHQHSNESTLCRKIECNCRHIAVKKPESFEQALQLLWIMHEMMIAEGNIKGISLGRMDQYLYPFYERDVAKGILNDESAYRLICSMWKKFEFDRKALAFQNVTIGGGY